MVPGLELQAVDFVHPVSSIVSHRASGDFVLYPFLFRKEMALC